MRKLTHKWMVTVVAESLADVWMLMPGSLEEARLYYCSISWFLKKNWSSSSLYWHVHYSQEQYTDLKLLNFWFYTSSHSDSWSQSVTEFLITCFLVSCCCPSLSVIHDIIHLLPGSFPNCTRSSSHFWGTKSSLMLCQGSRIATWRGEGAGRWIMPPASAWGPATGHCPRPTSNLNAADALPYARRYIH